MTNATVARLLSKVELIAARQGSPMKTVTLEARVSDPADKPFCEVCGCCRKHRPEMTELYLVGTQDWVCETCGYVIDSDLARFAYEQHERPDPKTFKELDESEGCFGICPECGDTGVGVNITKAHFSICKRHGLWWGVGWNIFSSWQFENEDIWEKHYRELVRCRKVEPCFPPRSKRRRDEGDPSKIPF